MKKTHKYYRFFFVVLFFVLPATGQSLSNQQSDDTINIILRCDDYTTFSSTKIEKKILKSLERHKAIAVFGVVPFHKGIDNALTEEKVKLLRKAIDRGFVEPALHGFDHIGFTWKGVRSEFFGRTLNDQRERLKKGKSFLEEVLNEKILSFVPPMNGYDHNTLKALEETGIKLISANRLGLADKDSPLKYLPMTCYLHEVRDAIKSARLNDEQQSVIVAMFHPYEFKENNKNEEKLSIQKFDDLLGWLASQKDIKFSTFHQLLSSDIDLSSSRYSKFRSFSKFDILIPGFLKKSFNLPFGTYLSLEVISKVRSSIWIVVFMLYGAIAVIAYCFSAMVIKFLSQKTIFLGLSYKLVWPTSILFVSWYTLRDGQFGHVAALAMSTLIGAAMGSLFPLCKDWCAKDNSVS